MNCTSCNKPLCKDPRRKTNLCRDCLNRDPDYIARRSAAMKLRYAADPMLRLRLKEAHKNRYTPEIRARLSESAKANRNWEKTTKEGRLKWQQAGVRAIVEKRLGWCPRELREEYRRLTVSLKFSAAEAKAIILAQHEKDMAEFRRKLGAA